MGSISYNLGVATLARFVVGFIGLFVIGILTRTLGPVGYGVYSTIFAYVFVGLSLADLGLYTILLREISKAGADERYITSNIITLRLFVTILVLCVVDCAVYIFYYPSVLFWGIIIASLVSVLMSLSQIMNAVFQRYLRLHYVALADIAGRVVQLMLLLIISRSHPSILLFIEAVLISEAIHFLLIFLFTQRFITIRFAFDYRYWWHIVRLAVPIAASLIFVLLYFKLDTLMLSWMKSPYDVGVYSAAYKILETVIFIPAMYAGLIMPFLSRFAAHRDIFLKFFHDAFHVITIMAFPAGAYIFIFSHSIITLLGGVRFVQSAEVLKILSFAIITIFFGNLGGNSLIALNLQKKGMWIYGSGAFINIILNFMFIPRYSYMAAAWNTVITEVFVTLLMFIFIYRAVRFVLPWSILSKSILASVLMAVCIIPFRSHFIYASLLALVYFPILFSLRGFSMADLRAVMRMKQNQWDAELSARP